MAINIKRIKLWRKEIENQPGSLAATLEPMAATGANLQVVMGYRYPGEPTKGAVELYPVTGKKAVGAAQAAGIAASAMPVLLVTGDDKPGTGSAIAKGIAEAGINLDFLVAQVIGRKYSAVLGFDNEGDARRASAVIKKTAARKR